MYRIAFLFLCLLTGCGSTQMRIQMYAEKQPDPNLLLPFGNNPLSGSKAFAQIDLFQKFNR